MKYEVWTTELIKRIYDDVPNDDDDIDYAWCISNLGAKWMHSEFEYDDDCSCICKFHSFNVKGTWKLY